MLNTSYNQLENQLNIISNEYEISSFQLPQTSSIIIVENFENDENIANTTAAINKLVSAHPKLSKIPDQYTIQCIEWRKLLIKVIGTHLMTK